MIAEIILGLSIVIVLLYSFTQYLKWSNGIYPSYVTYQTSPNAVSDATRTELDNWGWALPPEYLADSYKPASFWIQYYWDWLRI